MSNLHRVRLADAKPEPWRNGGGSTRELLAWRRKDDWLLRVSVAAITDAGAFSAFPGVTRWFAVLDGVGVVLELPDRRVEVGAGDPPLRFEGEAAPMCHLVEGPTQDLNFMVRRDAGPARMQPAEPGSGVEGGTRWRGVYAHGDAVVDCDGVAEPLRAGTLMWSDEVDSTSWQLRQGRHVFWLVLQER